jgi:hypothetical protein
MAIAFPSATIAVIRRLFYAIATRCAYENPNLPFGYLHSVKRGFFFITKAAYFCFHSIALKLIFVAMNQNLE